MKARTLRRRPAPEESAARIVSALKVLWDLQTKVRVEDRKAGLILALARVSDVLHPVQEIAAPSLGTSGVEAPVAFGDMARMLSSQ